MKTNYSSFFYLSATALLLLAANNSFAQSPQTTVVEGSDGRDVHVMVVSSNSSSTDDAQDSFTKNIEITEVDGVKTMSITTVKDGEKEVKVLKGEEVDNYLIQAEDMNVIQKDGATMMFFSDEGKVMSEDIEKQVQLLLEEQGITGDHKTVTVRTVNKTSHADASAESDVDVDVDVTEVDGIKTITIKKTNAAGEVEEEVIKLDDATINTWIEEGKSNGMTEEIDVNVEFGEGGKSVVKTIIVTRSLRIEDLNASEAEEFKTEPSKKELKIDALKFYPNPGNGLFTLEFQTPNNGEVEIVVNDVKGRQVYQQVVEGKGNYTHPIDLSNKSKGLYILTLRQGKKSTHKKLVIE